MILLPFWLHALLVKSKIAAIILLLCHIACKSKDPAAKIALRVKQCMQPLSPLSLSLSLKS